MKKLLLLSICFLTLNVFGQETVTLFVSGDGNSKDEAITNALNIAISQTYGCFISSNTAILNDELIRDEIISISSGNVQSYEIVSYATLPCGKTFVSLKATISQYNLISYAKSKGVECEISASSYLMNIKLKKLNELNTRIAISNLISQLKGISKFIYDYQLETEIINVDENKETATIGLTISVYANENAKEFITYLRYNLQAIGQRSGCTTYNTILQYYDSRDCCFDKMESYINSEADALGWYYQYYNNKSNIQERKELYKIFLSEYQMRMLSVIFDDAYYNFEITDNLDNKYFIPVMRQIGQKYKTGLYISFGDFLYNTKNELKYQLLVDEQWNWVRQYEYAARFVKSKAFKILYEFSAEYNDNSGETSNIITVPCVLYDQSSRIEKKATANQFSPSKIGERKVNIVIPIETFAKLTSFKISSCGEQYESILERVCNVIIKNNHKNMEYVDLGLPSGTLWAKDNAYAAPISGAIEAYGQRIPTKAQFQELLDNCRFEIVSGYESLIDCEYGGTVRATGPNGNKIYFCLTGIIDESKTLDASTIGKSVIFWVRTYNVNNGYYYAYIFTKDNQTNELKPIECKLENPRKWCNIRFVH